MDWLIFFFFLSVLLFLWALIFHIFTGWFLIRSIKKKYKVEPGPKPFSISSLIINTNDFTLTIKDMRISLNFFGLISSRFVFFALFIDSIEFEFFHKPKSRFQRKIRSVSENIFIQVLLHILIMLIRKITVKVNLIILKKSALSAKITNIDFKYFTKAKKFCGDLEIKNISISIKNLISMSFQPISFHPRYDYDPILSIINLEAIAVPFRYDVQKFEMVIDKDLFTISPINVAFTLPRGKIFEVTPEVKAKLSIPFPHFRLSIQGLSGFFSRHFYEVADLNLDKILFSIKNLDLYNEDRIFLTMRNYFGSKISNDPWSHDCKKIDVMYHTKTGLCLIPFITQNFLPYFEKMMKKPKNIKLPGFKLNNKKILLHFKLTDLAIADIIINNTTMEDGKMQISSIDLLMNDVKVLVFKTFNIFAKDTSNEKRQGRRRSSTTQDQSNFNYNENYQDCANYLAIKFKSLRFHGRPNMYIDEFFLQTLYAWRAIAPYILKHYVDRESLPFPILLKCKIVTCKYHDTPLHQTLSCANRVLPKILQDSFIREHILERRAKELSMPESAQKLTLEKLKQLAFKEYVQEQKNSFKHKYKFKFVFTKLLLFVNARGFTEKIKFIHQVDPATKLYYPDMIWEAVFGFAGELSFKKLEVFAFDIEKPIIFGTDISFKGPVVIAEPRHKEFTKLHFKLDGEDFVSTKNPMKLRIYTDMLISSDHFYYYFADCLSPIFQEMSICFLSTFPQGVDPSPRLVWWDMMRSQMRGQYLFKANIFEARFYGTRNYRDLSDYMPIKLEKWQMLWKEGDSLMTADRWISPRVYKDVEGPISLDIPKLHWTFKFHWVSANPNYDCRKYIIFPIVKKFGEPGYDTYKDFRSTEIVMDDSTMSFTENTQLGHIPNFTLDIAHYEWFSMPLTIFSQSQGKKCQYKKKYGIKEFSRPPFKYFNQIKRHGWLRIISNVFIFRIFDHFPISGNSKSQIQGSSIDLRLNDFQMLAHCDMRIDGSKFATKFKSEEISINATDLAHYASVDPRRTPSFIAMTPLIVESADETNLMIGEITLHFNQFLLQYIQDFMKTTETIREKFSKGKKEKPLIEYYPDDFPIQKVRLNIDTIKVLFVSLESELQAMALLEKTTIFLLQKEVISSETDSSDEFYNQTYSTDTPLMLVDTKASNNIHKSLNNLMPSFESAVRILFNKLQFVINTQDPTITGENPLIQINGPDAFVAGKFYLLDMKSIALNASPMDISALSSIFDELFGGDKKATPPGSPDKLPETKIKLSIPVMKIGLETNTASTLCIFHKINSIFHVCPDQTIEISFIINLAKITNNSKDPSFRKVIDKWEQQSVQTAERPLVQIQIKMLPKISDAYIFSQVEINIEPTIICYDTRFWDDLISIFKSSKSETPNYGEPFILMDDNINIILPFQTFDKTIFPEDQDESQKLYNITNKSIKMKKRNKETKTMMMMRYFRLNPISMNVSYRNPDNKILSEINNFQGQLHEIIYHDISVSTTELFGKLVADIAKDMIPQFIKHVVGIKRPDKTQEQVIEEWLKNDDHKLSQTEKQKKLLFGSKPSKKR